MVAGGAGNPTTPAQKTKWAETIQLNKHSIARFDFTLSSGTLHAKPHSLVISNLAELQRLRRILLRSDADVRMDGLNAPYPGHADRLTFETPGNRDVVVTFFPDSVWNCGGDVERVYWSYWRKEFPGVKPLEFLAWQSPAQKRHSNMDEEVRTTKFIRADLDSLSAQLAKDPDNADLKSAYVKSNDALGSWTLVRTDLSLDQRYALAKSIFLKSKAIKPIDEETDGYLQNVASYYKSKKVSILYK